MDTGRRVSYKMYFLCSMHPEVLRIAIFWSVFVNIIQQSKQILKKMLRLTQYSYPLKQKLGTYLKCE